MSALEILETMTHIYLDYNATTPLAPEVLETIYVSLKDVWGNPSSSYDKGKKAKETIETARANVARMINAHPLKREIIFTSGGTEANNMVLNSALKYYWSFDSNSSYSFSGPHIITSNLEHDSVRLVLERFLQDNRAEVTFVPASKASGRVEVDDVLAAIRPNTCLITIMTANNESGIIQPVGEISRRIRELNSKRKKNEFHILLHTDAAQCFGKVEVNVEKLGVDYLTIVGHKFYGPRMGALYVRDLNVASPNAVPLYPMLFGGGQESNLRPGTENTGMIAGLGKAAELVVANLEEYRSHMTHIRDYLERRLVEVFGDRISINGKYQSNERLPNTCNFSFLQNGFHGYKILANTCRLEASTGAACHSGTHGAASKVLIASGVLQEVAVNAIRLSVGRQTTKEEVDIVIEDLKQAVDKLTKSI